MACLCAGRHDHRTLEYGKIRGRVLFSCLLFVSSWFELRNVHKIFRYIQHRLVYCTHNMPSSPTWFIALVVVQDADRFVLVHEQRNRGWYLPAGKVDPGETLEQGAIRETEEESGLQVALAGVIRFEFSPALMGRDARFRVVFLAHPVGGRLKTKPDRHSLEARWTTLNALENYRLRCDEVRRHLRYVAAGGPIAPLSFLRQEGASYPL